MAETYTATQVGSIFSVTRESVRRWALEFTEHLSPMANPGDGRQRSFTDADLAVIALVASEKQQGKRFDEIHAMLSNGERGKAPPGVSALAINEQRPAALSARINRLELELSDALKKVTNLEGRLEQSSIQYEQQLATAHARIEQLVGELALLKAGKK